MTSPAVGPEIGGLTLGEALRRTATNHPDTVAVRTPDDSVSLTWSELLRRVERVAGGLAKLGVARGDTVAIMLSNRPEFHIADLAAVLLGATPFSIYLTYPPAEIEYLMRDAACRIAIVEQAHTSALLEASKALPELEHVIVVDGEPPEGATSLAAVEASNPDFDPTSEVPETAPEDLVTLIYTSGTTGPPKGVQLSHRNVMAGVETFEQLVAFGPGSRVISWLPAAHIAERMAHHYIPVVLGGTITCCPNPREVVSYLPQVRPNWFFAVPRIWEKLKAGLEAMQAAAPEEQQRPVQEALAAALERVRLTQRGEPVPAELEEKVAQADTQMFSKLREMLGLDQAVAVNVGAAPTPLEVLEFFHALGIELAELWGMSETCGSGSCNRSGEVKLGTVGPPSPGVEMKIGPDGELLVRGDCVMVGYRGAPDKTAEALDGEGWLHTGDIASIDDDGYVRIVDRKKEIIINS
ncbi:MAG TPA: AMP-binding protein, partial [Solirubrobacteraceae bacterium]